MIEFTQCAIARYAVSANNLRVARLQLLEIFQQYRRLDINFRIMLNLATDN